MHLQQPPRTPDDPPKDPTIAGWFAALGPPPSGPAPPYLQAQVRARLVQAQAQRGLRAWLPRWRSSPWSLVLASGLVLSLGGNVWWGLQTFGSHAPGARQGTVVRQERAAARRVSIAQWQSQITLTPALGTFVAAHAAERAPAAIATFTPQAARTTFVRLGTVYAEALATLASGAGEETLLRLDMLARDLTSVRAPVSLVQYLRAIHTLLQRQPPPGEEIATFLALFESLYDEAYAGTDTGAWLRLFRTGAWLENMYLAAAAQDAAALQRGGAVLEEVRSTLAQGPPEILAALTQMQRLLSQPGLTEGEIRTLQRLVQDIQDRLRG